ncbi:MAG: efflux RND transporter periplasmic adaptor subunit [Polyangiaceae bacterium]|nr:efflux RND transporter periplasmic adaptor subunit [Polyangiaceae bacterium]
MLRGSLAPFVITGGLLAADAGCKGKEGPPPPGPVEVGVVTLATRPVTLTTEVPGRTSPFRVAEVRARVDGIVLSRLFTEGSDVEQGAVLFQIDPAPYEAALARAKATLARAEATLTASKLQAERYGNLLASNAVSKQEYDDAVAARKAAEADVAAGHAAVKTAQLDLGYTTVKAPVSGRIGRAAVTEGAFVRASEATLLATVQQLDPLYVDVTWASGQALNLKRDLESGKLQGDAKQAEVTLLLEGGREHPQHGTLQFTDPTVDLTTGSISLRAIVPNPNGDLLPGLFVRARFEEGTVREGLLAPQRGITRDTTGRPIALVVGPDQKAERRQVKTDRAIGDAWLVIEGLRAGDQLIVEGLQKVRPGTPVRPVPVEEAKQAAR